MTKKIVPIVSWTSGGHFPKVMNFLNRESVEEKAMIAATSILKKVKMNGDKAVIDAARKFDHSNITIDTIKISKDEIKGLLNLNEIFCFQPHVKFLCLSHFDFF